MEECKKCGGAKTVVTYYVDPDGIGRQVMVCESCFRREYEKNWTGTKCWSSMKKLLRSGFITE